MSTGTGSKATTISYGSGANHSTKSHLIEKAAEMDMRYRRLYKFVKGKEPQDPYRSQVTWPRDPFEHTSPAVHGHYNGESNTSSKSGRNSSRQKSKKGHSGRSSRNKSSATTDITTSNMDKHERYRLRLRRLGEETDYILALIEDALTKERDWEVNKHHKSDTRSLAGSITSGKGHRGHNSDKTIPPGKPLPTRRSTRTGRRLYTPRVDAIVEITEPSDSSSDGASNGEKKGSKKLTLNVTSEEYLILKGKVDELLDRYFNTLNDHYHESGTYRCCNKVGENQAIFAKFAKLFKLYEPIFGMEYLPTLPKKRAGLRRTLGKMDRGSVSTISDIYALDTRSAGYYFNKFAERQANFRTYREKEEKAKQRAQKLEDKDSRYWNKDYHLFDTRPPFRTGTFTTGLPFRLWSIL